MPNTHTLKNSTINPTGAVMAHVPAVDGLRGIAIIYVMLHHFSPEVSGGHWTRRFLEFAHMGWAGVDLFFVLSGFLITSILLRTRHHPDYFVNFYARRTLRIFPIYYAVLAMVLIVLPLSMRIPLINSGLETLFKPIVKQLPSLLNEQSWLWLYGSNIKIALEGERWGAVNHFWTLAVEEHFYLVWPLVVFFASRRTLVNFCIACMISAPLLRGLLMVGGADPVIPYVLTPCRVDSLCCGALLAAVILQPNGPGIWMKRLSFIAFFAGIGMMALIVGNGRFDRKDLLTSMFGYTLLSLISACIVLFAARSKPGTSGHSLLGNKFLTSFGKYSYGIYISHAFFIYFFTQLLPWTTLTRFTGSYLAAIILHATVSIGISWCIGWLSFHAFEQHFLKLKFLFNYQKPSTDTSIPTTIPARRPVLPGLRPAA